MEADILQGLKSFFSFFFSVLEISEQFNAKELLKQNKKFQ